MFKIFLRKRFVCGYMHKDFEEPRWRASFKTVGEAYIFGYFVEYKSAMYDRKSKVTVQGKEVEKYFKFLELRKQEEVECTAK